MKFLHRHYFITLGRNEHFQHYHLGCYNRFQKVYLLQNCLVFSITAQSKNTIFDGNYIANVMYGRSWY